MTCAEAKPSMAGGNIRIRSRPILSRLQLKSEQLPQQLRRPGPKSQK
jgi:hypothetical protein